MKTLEKLLKALNEDENIKSYKALEKTIEGRSELNNAYEDLLEKQKAMVRSETLGKPDYEEKRKDYENALETLKNKPVIHQYLTLQEDINDDMRLLFSIIENGVNGDD